MLLFLQAVNTNVAVDGGFIDKVGMLFQNYGVYTSLFAFFLVVVIVLIYKAGSIYLSKENQKREDELERIKKENIELREKKAVEEALEKENAKEEKHQIKPNFEIQEFKDLSKHPYFVNAQYILDVKLKEISVSSKNKKNILIDFIYAKIKTSRDVWYEVLRDAKIAQLSPDELKGLLIGAIIQSQKEFDRTLDKFEIPEIAIEKLKDSVSLLDKMLFATIENFCDSDLFQDSFDIVYMVLDYNISKQEVLITHLQLNIEKLNGQLEITPYETKIK